MKMSAVICTRNRPDMIGRAVSSVLANDHPDFELIIIDQSTTDATRVAIEEAVGSPQNLTYVHRPKPGLSGAYNAGIACAKGELIAFTDDDCYAPVDWLTNIDKAFENAPDANLLYGQVLLPEELRGTDGVTPTLLIPETRRIGPGHGFEIFGMGANFAARSALFDMIGRFDEVLGGGGPLRSSQDFDLQYRVYRAKLVTLLASEVAVDHYGLRTTDTWPETLTAYGIGDGGFYMKHIRCRDPLAAWLLMRRLASQSARCAIKPLLRQDHSSAYLTGVVRGMRQSFKYDVDRPNRCYVMP